MIGNRKKEGKQNTSAGRDASPGRWRCVDKDKELEYTVGTAYHWWLPPPLLRFATFKTAPTDTTTLPLPLSFQLDHTPNSRG